MPAHKAMTSDESKDPHIDASTGYFDHDADVGVIGRGATVEDAFVCAAEAMFGLMVRIDAIEPSESVRLSFSEFDVELALARWLNALLAEARVSGLALGRFELQRDNGQWAGRAWGEPWREGLDRGVEVKGATLTMLSVTCVHDGWEARCVVDV